MTKGLTPQKKYERVCQIHRTKDGLYGGFIDGKLRSEKPCGFCKYKEHLGTLSQDLIKNHKCLSKNCHYLVRYSESDFFRYRELRNLEKKLKKQGIDSKSVLDNTTCCMCGRPFKTMQGDNVVTFMKRLKSSKWVLMPCGDTICWKCAKESKKQSADESVVSPLSNESLENLLG